MTRFVIIVAAFLLAGVALACSADRSSQEQVVSMADTPIATVEPRPTPTQTPPATVQPTPTPSWDVMTQCGPPLDERYCAVWWRPPPPSCPVSRPVTIRADGLLAIGGTLVWKVGTHVSRFDPEREVWKTIWIVADGVVGEVKVTGRRLDGPGTIVFPTYERDEGFVETRGNFNPENFMWQRTELVLKPSHGLREDHRTTLVYPSAGCWQFTAQVGTETVEIVKYLYEEPP